MKNSLLKKLCAVSLAAFMLVGTGVAEIGSFVGTGVEVSAAATSARSFEYSENSDGEELLLKNLPAVKKM